MSDIDFLANKTRADDQEPKKNSGKKEKIIWSKPEANKPASRGTGFIPLPSFNKDNKKEIKNSAAEPRPMIDKEKIRQSRQEILKLIKRNESLGLKEEKQTGKSFWSGWLEIFKKRPNRKEALVDYHQAFSHEKAKRSLPARPIEAAPFTKAPIQSAPVKQAAKVILFTPVPPQLAQVKKVINPPAKETKPVLVKPAKAPGQGFFSKLLKFIKDTASASSKPRPVKVNLSETIKESKSKTIPASIRPVPPQLTQVKKTIIPPAKEIKPVPAKPAKAPGQGFFSKLLKFIKDGMSASSKPRPVKVNLSETIKGDKPKTIPVPIQPAPVKQPGKVISFTPVPPQLTQVKKPIIPPAKEIKPVLAKPAKVLGQGFFSKFLRFIKDIMSAPKLPKAKPVNVNLSNITKDNKPKTIPVTPPKPPIIVKKEIKIEEKPPVPPQLVQVKKTIIPPAKEIKPVLAKPPKAPGQGFFSKLLKFIKDKMSVFSKPKTVNVNLSKTTKDNKPKTIPVPIPKPPIVVKKEIKIEEKPSEQTEPIQMDKDFLRVIETNLIKGEAIAFFDWHKKIINLISAVLVPIFIVGAIYLGLIYYQKQAQAKIQVQSKKFDQLMQKISQEEVGLAEITAFQAKLKMVSQIFVKHIYWTNFFKFLEDNTLKNVYYSGFSGDTGGSYQFDATALKFSDISEQVNILKNNQKMVDVKTTGGEMTQASADSNAKVKFNLNFSILKRIFTE